LEICSNYLIVVLCVLPAQNQIPMQALVTVRAPSEKQSFEMSRRYAGERVDEAYTMGDRW